MKKISSKFYLLILAIYLFMPFNITSIHSQTYNSLYSTNGTILWLVGNQGVIYRSGDGGQSFVSKSQGTANYNSITGIPGTMLWISGSEGTLLKSTNTGINFTASVINASENLTSISFTDANTGWVATGSGKIYNTTNGGYNWSQQVSPTSNYLNKIKFSNSTTGVACGLNGTLLKTINGGINWNVVTVPVNKELFSIDIRGNLLLACSKDGVVIKSTDLGLTWVTVLYKAVVVPDVTGLAISNDSTVFICGEGGFIKRSIDKGLTYSNQLNPSWCDMRSMYFFNSLTGWAIGSNNMVLRTINSGQNWYMPTGTTIELNWIQKIPLNFYTSSGNVFYQSTWNKKEIFVTKANTVYRSLDIGESWSQVGTAMPYGAISNSFFVSPKDTNIFIVAIDSIDNMHGKVLRSTNYGQTWQITFSANRSSDGIPMAMDPNHSDTLYYGPTDSVMFRSTNFGLNWAPLGSYRFENNCSIKVLNKYSNIIIVGTANSFGSKGLITRSTDYGATWTIVDSNRGPYPEVPAISGSILDTILYATMYAGNEGGVKRSINNGLTWNYINIDYAAWGFDRAGDDPNVICYAPWDYTLSTAGYISFDKGVHFTNLPSISTVNNFSVYFYNRNNLIIQQSVGFYKLKAIVSVPIGIQPISNEVPVNFSLSQNYPNPFNPSTNFRFELPVSSEVKLEVFDVLGRLVSTILNDKLNAGQYEMKWQAENYPSGVYFYKLSTDNFTQTRKMILLK